MFLIATILWKAFSLINFHICGYAFEIIVASCFLKRNISAFFDFTLRYKGEGLFKNIYVIPKCSFLFIYIICRNLLFLSSISSFPSKLYFPISCSIYDSWYDWPAKEFLWLKIFWKPLSIFSNCWLKFSLVTEIFVFSCLLLFSLSFSIISLNFSYIYLFIDNSGAFISIATSIVNIPLSTKTIFSIFSPSYINIAFLFENKGIKLVKTLEIKSVFSIFLKKLNLCIQLSYTLNKTKFLTE